MNIGILQPGRLGDIIICLPIAKYYADRGYDVTWPMFKSAAEMVKEVVNYIDIIPVTDNVCVTIREAKEVLNARGIHGNNIVDLAATFPGSACTEEYVSCGDGLGPETFDAFKYRLAGVPLEEKWNLHIIRNHRMEKILFEKYVKQENYAVSCLTHSKGSVNLKLDAGECNIIPMNMHHNLFHWIKILEQAKAIVCVESSVSNLVEQLKLPNRKFLVKKPDGRTPSLKGNWRII